MSVSFKSPSEGGNWRKLCAAQIDVAFQNDGFSYGPGVERTVFESAARSCAFLTVIAEEDDVVEADAAKAGKIAAEGRKQKASKTAVSVSASNGRGICVSVSLH